MANSVKKATLDDAWEIVRELGEAQKETDRQLKALGKSQEETGRQLKGLGKSQEETDRQLKETDRQLKETDRQLKGLGRSIEKTNGNFNTKWGKFLEDLVKGDMVNLLNERNIKVGQIHPRVQCMFPGENNVEAEYDLIAVNGDEVVVFEVKTTLGSKDVESFVEKLKKFRGRFHQYGDKKIYGGMAYMSDEGGFEKAGQEGLFLVKAPGGANKASCISNPPDFRPRSF